MEYLIFHRSLSLWSRLESCCGFCPISQILESLSDHLNDLPPNSRWQTALLAWRESAILLVEASQEYRMRQCWCCQIAGIWIKFHSAQAVSSADGPCQTSNTTLIRTRGVVLTLACTHFMHTCQKASFNNMYSSSRGKALPRCSVV